MIAITYPDEKPSIRQEGSKELVFCLSRKKWVTLTPEEWVRQNFMLYLIHKQNIPVSLIAVEKQIRVGELNKRFDMVVYDRDAKPFMVIECKEMHVNLSEDVLHQALRYNMTLQTPHVLITNGNQTAVFTNDSSGFRMVDAFPSFT